MADRLNFVDVEHLVAELSDAKLEQLTLGPLPDSDDPSSPWNCRICATLRGPNQTPPATQLLDWHEFEAEVDEIDRLMDVRRIAGRSPGPGEQWEKVAGMLSHARCCTIYALARIELAGRRL